MIGSDARQSPSKLELRIELPRVQSKAEAYYGDLVTYGFWQTHQSWSLLGPHTPAELEHELLQRDGLPLKEGVAVARCDGERAPGHAVEGRDDVGTGSVLTGAAAAAAAAHGAVQQCSSAGSSHACMHAT